METGYKQPDTDFDTLSEAEDAGLSEEERAIVERAKTDGSYLKAPNGKPTNLSPKQWAQVRTKAFKDWFGDWELCYKMVENVIVDDDAPTDRKQARQKLAELTQPFHNTDQDVDIYVSQGDARHSLSFRSEEQIRALSKVKELIKKAVKVGEVKVDTSEKETTKAVHIYYAPIKIKEQQYSTRLVVKEYFQGNQVLDEMHLYNYQLRKMASPAQSTSQTLLAHPGKAIPHHKISDLIHSTQAGDEIFLNNHSKVVDGNGEPLVVQHGSPIGDLTIFDEDHIGENTGDEGVYGAGFYFEKKDRNYPDFSMYGDNIYEVYLNMNAPRRIDTEGDILDLLMQFDTPKVRKIRFKSLSGKIATMGDVIDAIKEVREAYGKGDYDELIEELKRYFGRAAAKETIYRKISLKGYVFPTSISSFINECIDSKELSESFKKEGHDGIIVDGMREIVSFSSNQIKSATDNVGTFDAGNADIRFRRNGFQNGINTDEVLDLFSEQSDYGTGGAVRLIQDLEEHFGGELESASSGARNALENGLVPFAGNKYAGTDNEYHHMAFVDENGERRVESVPFTKPENLKEVRPDLRFSGDMFEADGRPKRYNNKAPKDKSKGAVSSETELRTNHQGSVVSFDDTAKIRKNLDDLASHYSEISRPNTFIGDLSNALELKNHGNNSNYGTFEAKNGVEVRIRISDHNASAKNFDDAGYKEGISIVVSRKPNKGISDNGESHITEYYYNAYKLAKADGKPLVDIIRSVKQALYSGEYNDKTGLAERAEVNAGIDLMFRFIGEKGAANLDKAEEATTRLDNLAVAREMEEAGKDAKTVKMATGWERGADGKWRYEMEDNLDGVEFKTQDELEEGYRNARAKSEEANRKWIFFRDHHPILNSRTSNYAKRVKNSPEEVERKKKFAEARKEERRLFKEYSRLSDIADSLWRRVNDGIQGVPLDEVLGKNHPLLKAYPEMNEIEVSFYPSGRYIGSEDSNGHYNNRYHSIFISTDGTREKMRSTLAHELQHAVQDIEGFAQGGSPNMFLDENRERIKELQALKVEIEAEIERGDTDREEELQEIEIELFDLTEDSPVHKYRSLAGEVEARNVQARLDMTRKERRASLASETEDVAREDQIFLNETLGSSASVKMKESIEDVNGRFNEQLDGLTEATAAGTILSLGSPSGVLLAAGVADKPMRLYGNKVMAKIKKHGYPVSALRDLPRAVAAPIAVFNNYGRTDNRSILTELKTTQGNMLVAVTIGQGGADVDFNVVSSVFGKDKEKVAAWINKGYATYIDKKKALDYISVPAPIAGAQYSQGLSNATKIVENFENPKLSTHAQIKDLGDKLHTPIRIVKAEDVRHDDPDMEKRMREAKGWFNTKTGEVVLIIDNHTSMEDVTKTVLHEVVGHKGLRGIMNEKTFQTMCESVYRSMPPALGQAYLRQYGIPAVAGEEYLAHVAENGAPASVMSRITSAIKVALNSIGIQVNYSDKEMQALLKRSRRHLEKNPEQRQRVAVPNKRETGTLKECMGLSRAYDKEKLYATILDEENKIKEVNKRFNEELQLQAVGRLPQGHVYQLGKPSMILNSAGIPDLPIEMLASRLSDKAMQENHPFGLIEVKNLVSAIQNPLAVFRSATHVGSNVILTELNHKGRNFVVAIQTNKKKGAIEINDIRSLYPKNSVAITRWVTDDLMDYADKRRMVEWLSKQRSNSAEVRKPFDHATKVVQNFENPKQLEKYLELRHIHPSQERKQPVVKPRKRGRGL